MAELTFDCQGMRGLRMTMLLYALAALFGLLTLVSLLLGVVGMGNTNAFYERHANRLMRFRIVFQVLAIAALFAAVSA